MGEVAEMMLNGDLDMETGEYLGPGAGYPKAARPMAGYWSDVFPKGMHGGRKPKDTPCELCGKKLRGKDGLTAHVKAVHRGQ